MIYMADLSEHIASDKIVAKGTEKEFLDAVRFRAMYIRSMLDQTEDMDETYKSMGMESGIPSKMYGSDFGEILTIIVSSFEKEDEVKMDETDPIGQAQRFEDALKTMGSFENGSIEKIISSLSILKYVTDDPSASNLELYRGFIPSDPDSPDVAIFKALASSDATTPLLKFHAQSIIKRHEELAAKTAKATTGNKASKGKNGNKSS